MIHFTKAQIQHAQEINLLVNSAYRGDSSKVGWTTEADLLDGQRTDVDKISEMIESETSRIEMALDENDNLMGCVFLEQERDALYLGMLTVDPTLQAQGLGKLLMLRSEEIAREVGLSKIRMTVISSRTELIAFYERRGFSASGKTQPFPEDDPRFGLPKTKGMIFQEFIKLL